MIQYTIKRIFQTIPVLLGVIVITFILMYMIPGDPVVSMVGERYDEQTIKKLREELKLDDPLPVQFIDYVSNVFQGNFGKSFITGEPVMRTSRATRGVAYVGAVLHWLYFTPLRSQAALWSTLVIWVSILGCLLCLSGLFWGVWRLSLTTTYRLRAGNSHSPYAGLMRWHHYGGLLFGLVSFTWVFSGGLSMEPWNWHPGTTPTRVQRDAVTGGTPRLGPLQVGQIQAGLAALAHVFEPKELEVLQFRGEVYLWAQDPLAGPDVAAVLPRTLASLSTQVEDQRLVAINYPERGVFTRFDADELVNDQIWKMLLE